MARYWIPVATAAMVGIATATPAHAGPGDPSAAFIATKAAPGETTSTRCNSNGFTEVIFSVGMTVVSTVESGDTCTPGTPTTSVGSGRSQGEIDAIAQAEIDSDAQFDSTLDEFGDLWDIDVFDGWDGDGGDGGEDGDGDGDTGENEDGTEDEEDNSALEDAKRELDAALGYLASEQKNVASLKNKISTLQAERAAAMETAQAAFDEAEAKHTEALLESERWMLGLRALKRFKAIQQEAIAATPGTDRSEYLLEQLDEARADLSQYGIAESLPIVSAENSMAAAEVRLTITWNAVQAAEAELEGVPSEYDGDIELAEFDLKQAESRLKTYMARVEELRAKVRLLQSSNQLSGAAPSPTLLQLLQARGVRTWVSGSFSSAEDKRSGQRRDIDSWRLVAGGQVRLTERTAVGMSAAYSFADTDDRTGVATSTESDSYMAAPYVAYRLSPNAGIRAGVVYSQTETDLERPGGATASYTTRAYGARIGASGQKTLNPWVSVQGSLGQSYFYSETDSYSDTAGTAVPSSDRSRSTTHAGGRVNVTATPDLKVFGGVSVDYAMFTSDDERDRADAYASLGLDYAAHGALISAEVGQTLFRNNYSDIGARVTVQVDF
ncbi:MAG: autotransporter domain-containing protein [Candidatus Phaeomarinobacter sp.]